ncbi:MAG: hypothetical protein JSV82_01950 [Planctomycetota bacterium]|nr:MAG: hypothetical protein JSV82_01950 [Planctomycetota bacterium]
MELIVLASSAGRLYCGLSFVFTLCAGMWNIVRYFCFRRKLLLLVRQKKSALEESVGRMKLFQFIARPGAVTGDDDIDLTWFKTHSSAGYSFICFFTSALLLVVLMMIK